MIATKLKGLSRESIRKSVEGSLRRLQTDYIDLHYAHYDDPDAPQEETAAAFGELVAEGKVRHLAASNFSADRLASSLRIADELGVPRYVAVQPHYNLMERESVEGELAAWWPAKAWPCSRTTRWPAASSPASTARRTTWRAASAETGPAPT